MNINGGRADRMKNEEPIKKAGLSAKDPPACDCFFSLGFHENWRPAEKSTI
jgi:hypothetical protein